MRIVVVDQEHSARSALAMLVKAQRDMELTGDAADIGELLDLIQTAAPDVVVLDWDVLGKNIDELSTALKATKESPAVVALSVRPENRQASLDAGADGFACRRDPPERLLAAIRAVSKKAQP